LAAESDKRRELISELGRVFLKTSALRIGDYTTSEGVKTAYYIDLRPTLNFPPAVSIEIQCLEQVLREIMPTGPECICGIPVTGLIFSSILAFKLSTPLIYPVKDAREHKIAGIIKPGTRVVIIDDVSETGHSMVSAALGIRGMGGIVTEAVTIIDRSEGAARVLEKSGITLHPFTTAHEIAQTLKDNLALSDEESDIVETSQS